MPHNRTNTISTTRPPSTATTSDGSDARARLASQPAAPAPVAAAVAGGAGWLAGQALASLPSPVVAVLGGVVVLIVFVALCGPVRNELIGRIRR